MRVWIVVVTLSILLVSGVAGYQLLSQYAPPPSIQGAYLQPARNLDSFHLLDHNHRSFTREQLKGQWHLIAYGYTHCPDICPLTLVRLAELKRTLDEEDTYPDLQVLFYSVDSARDTPEQLALYTQYFHPDFIGLTRAPAPMGNYKNFEQSLGILSRTREEENIVSHGVMLLLINPKAQLQAVFKPEPNDHGMLHFDERRLLLDYHAVRRYYRRQ